MSRRTPLPLASPPRGMTPMGVFLLFGAAMALIAGTSLMRPGTALDRMWALNPRAYHELSHLGRSVGLLFLLLALALALTGHELAQATTMGLAVGGGHHRNSGSGQPREHFLRAYC